MASEVGSIFNMWVDVMKPVYNFHPKYRITMLTKKRGPEDLRLALQLRSSSGLQMGPRHCGNRGRSIWTIFGKRLSISLGKLVTVFRLKYKTSWSMLKKFKCTLDQSNALVFVLIVGRL